MNPGAFVAGGGGDGGGGSGQGGGGGSGDEGAGTEDGDANASGDGNSADGCGSGNEGDCNNCDTQIEAGDPVNVMTGEVTTSPHVDLFLPGYFNLALTRVYSSAHTKIDRGLGPGWRHSLAWSFEEHRRHLLIRTGDGRSVRFPQLPEEGMEAFSGGWALRRIPQGYILRPGNEFFHVFTKHRGSTDYHLTRVGYRNRGHLALDYQDGRLVRVVDTVGREVLFQRNPEGRISSIAVPVPHGPTLVFARYDYHPSGDLAAATDADGHTTRFFYDDEHRLVRLDYPSGVRFHFRYDASGRCFETWGDRAEVDPALAPDLPTTLADRETPARGIYHNKITFVDDDYTEVVHSMGMRRFERGRDGKIIKAVNERGGVTTRELDPRGRVTEQTDANDATWSWVYDELGAVVEERDPLGAHSRVTRDLEGRVLATIDPVGATLTLERDAHGEVVGAINPLGAWLGFTRNARGRITEVLDRRGARHLFEWDAHGNCTARTFPSGSTYRWTYDYWGRKLTETDPRGAVERYGYTQRGRLCEVIDRAGRRMTREYDSMGNITRESLPDGTSTRYDYGGLNWCYQTVLPDGSLRRRTFNREGWVTQLEDELGQRHELEYDRDGRVYQERFADGRRVWLEHDLLGRLVAFDEGDGKYLQTLDAVGRLLELEAPDGSKRSFTYDLRGLVMEAQGGGVTTRFQRDAEGAVTHEEQTFEDTTYTFKNERDPEGARTRVLSSLGVDQRLKRDSTGLVEAIEVDGATTLQFERNALGAVTRRQLELQAAIVDTLDDSNRLLRREIQEPSKRSWHAEPELVGAPPAAREWYYEYTTTNEIASVTEGNIQDTYEYDVRRHLKQRRSNVGFDESFTSDAAGNYTSANGVEREFAPGNQLLRHGDVRYVYDRHGQLLQRTEPRGGSEACSTFTWNAWRQLEAVTLPDGTQVTYTYDAFTRRQVKRVTSPRGEVTRRQHYVWDYNDLAHEVSLDAAGAVQGLRTYLYGEMQNNPLAHRDHGGEWVHYVGDLNDSPIELIDAQGRQLGRMDRSSFGQQRARLGSAQSTHIALPGQYTDDEVGLHYNRYRYYDPEAGRYISPDPIGFDGGWNLYAYGPNPIGWYDPLGTTHRMTVSGAPKGMLQHTYGGEGTTYASGMEYCPSSGPTGDLRSRARCHTEQKLAHDMLAYDAENPGSLRGRTIRATGQWPPCPNCHRALQRAAQETEANIEYSWDHNGESNSITYSGHTATFEGDAAVRLSEGYGMTQDASRRNGYAFDSFYGEGGAAAAYRELTGELPELD